MVEEQEKYKVLERILKSGTFSKTTTSSVLLKLLVDATIQNKDLSAYAIGLELFGKNFDPEKIEVNTRSNVYNLRKKLKSYYAEEGKQDDIQLKIESGSYKVLFLPVDNADKNKRKKKVLLFLCAFMVLLSLLVYTLNFSKPKTIWTPLIQSDKPITLFLGEVFGFFAETPFSKRGWIRDFHINSTEDFYNQVRKDPEKYANYKPADYNYVVFENALVIKPFTTYLVKQQKDFNINLNSDFSTKLIKGKNSIYAGPLFTDTSIMVLFNRFSKNTKIIGNDISQKRYSIELTNSKKHKDTIVPFNARKDSEYVLASCFEGPNNTFHYMFLANRGMGLNAVVDYFTNKDTLQEFEEQHANDSNEFTALFYVKGKDRTSIDLDLVFFDDNQ